MLTRIAKIDLTPNQLKHLPTLIDASIYSIVVWEDHVQIEHRTELNKSDIDLLRDAMTNLPDEETQAEIDLKQKQDVLLGKMGIEEKDIATLNSLRKA